MALIVWVRLYGLGGQEGGAYSVGEAVWFGKVRRVALIVWVRLYGLGGQQGGAYSVSEAVRFGRSGGWRL